jgi:hypothetical protein
MGKQRSDGIFNFAVLADRAEKHLGPEGPGFDLDGTLATGALDADVPVLHLLKSSPSRCPLKKTGKQPKTDVPGLYY